MEKYQYLSRYIVAAVVILALLSIGGNALVIWYVKQATPALYDDSEMAARIQRLEQGLAEVGALLGRSEDGVVALVHERFDALEDSLAALVSKTETLSERTQTAESSLIAELGQLSTHLHQLEVLAELSAQANLLQEQLEAVETSLAAQVSRLSVLLEERKNSDPEKAVPVFSPARRVEHVEGGVRLGILPGDTIWDLARRFENPPSARLITAIMELNGIEDPRRLQVGELLFIPIP